MVYRLSDDVDTAAALLMSRAVTPVTNTPSSMLG